MGAFQCEGAIDKCAGSLLATFLGNLCSLLVFVCTFCSYPSRPQHHGGGLLGPVSSNIHMACRRQSRRVLCGASVLKGHLLLPNRGPSDSKDLRRLQYCRAV